MFAVAAKKERTSRCGLSFARLIGPGQTEGVFPDLVAAGATHRQIPAEGFQGLL
jgi:hypothetical protein